MITYIGYVDKRTNGQKSRNLHEIMALSCPCQVSSLMDKADICPRCPRCPFKNINETDIVII